MKLFLICLAFLMLSAIDATCQSLDQLKLVDEEIPATYKTTDKSLHKSVQAINFYNQVDIYSSFLGTASAKEYQSFKSKKDSGTIFYFEFGKNFESSTFLEGLLWGEDEPSKAHPEEFFVKDNLLIIWSFGTKSQLKQISKEKISNLLK